MSELQEYIPENLVLYSSLLWFLGIWAWFWTSFYNRNIYFIFVYMP